MLRTTLKGLMGHKRRLITTMAAIVVGVAFMAGTLVLTNTLNKAFDDVFAATSKGTDALVRSSNKIKVNGDEQRAKISTSVVDTVRQTPGVGYAEGNISCNCAQVVGKDGKTIGGGGPPTLGFNWADDERLNPFTVVAPGQAPKGPDQAVIDKATADKAGFQVGDTVKIQVNGTPVEKKLVGIAKVGDNNSLLGATTVLLDRPTAEQLFGEPGMLSSISAVAADGVSQQQLVDNLQKTLPSGTDAITGQAYVEEQVKSIQESFLSFFNTFLLVFALIALFVGSFIIYNTFSIIVAQRTKEMALLRAVGASRRQVLGSVVLESAIVGAVASLLGLGFGILFASGLQGLLSASGFGIPSVSPVITFGSMLTAFLTGLAITMVAAVFPARKAAKIPPIAAMRDVSVDRTAVSVPRIISGVVLGLVGVGFIFLGLLASIDNAAAVVGLGAFLSFLGIAVLGPVIAKPVAGLIGLPVSATRGVSGRLARENSTRNPKRTSSTAMALLIGVSLVAMITVLAASIKTSFFDSIDKNFKADLIVDSGSFDGSNGLSPDIAKQLRTLPELSEVSEFRGGAAEINGDGVFLLGVNPQNVSDFVDFGVTQGSIQDLGTDGVAVDQKLAEQKGWKVGSTVTGKFAQTGEKPLRIVALIDRGEFGNGWIAGVPLFEANYTNPSDLQVFTKFKEGVPPDQARAAVEKVTAPYANATVQDIAQYKQAQGQIFDQLLGLVYGLLFLAILIAVLGIVATLSLSIFERTRELGLLRAVGMSRRQIRSTVRWESVIIALFGTLGGIGVGIFFGWALMTAIATSGFGALTIPFGQLLVIVIIAGIVGVGAGVWPGFRASRLDVLEAISTE